MFLYKHNHGPFMGFLGLVMSINILFGIVAPLIPSFIVEAATSITIVNGDFGDGNDENDITGWQEKGNEADASTFAKKPTTGNESISPNGGRFARIGKFNNDQGSDLDGSICQEINTEGFTDLVLSYEWRGDADGDTSDKGAIEYLDLKGGNCESADNKWKELTSHSIQGDNGWALATLPLIEDLEDRSFFLRFRTNASANDEFFRVDGIGLTGEPIVVPPVDVCPDINGVQTDVGECPPPVPSATVSATKVVCTEESALPNWGAGGAQITAATAQAWIGQSNGKCSIAPDWEFQWGDQTAPDGGATTVGPVSGYTTFSGTTTIPLSGITEIHLREVLKAGYIPFTGQNTTQDVSAEFYCTGDALNYDNWDFIRNPQAGQTYHCVGFNAPVVQQPPQCPAIIDVYSDSTVTVDGLITPAVAITPHPAWASIPGAQWIWASSAYDTTVDSQHTFTKKVTVTGTATTTLSFASDNGYLIKVNGVTVADQLTSEFNYGAVTTTPLSLVSGENTIEFTIKNIAVGGSTPASNPAGLMFKIHVEQDCTPPVVDMCPNIAETQTTIPEGYEKNDSGNCVLKTSTVTMCKVDEGQTPLSGWTLMLKKQKVQDLLVPANLSIGVTSDPLTAGMSYVATVAGIWLNQGGANPVDAEYSTTSSDWSTNVMDGYTGYSADILELQIDQSFDPNSTWGPYNSLHTYARSFVPSTSTANFRIFDGTGTTQNEGWFGDNSGSLAVSIFGGYAGVTGANGCVVFTGVPYGTYTKDEIQKAGWEHISGLGDLVVDSPTETVTIVNRDTTIPPVEPSFVKVRIYKYLKQGNEINTIPNTAALPGFPMVSTWQTANLNGGAVTNGNYVLGNYQGEADAKYGAFTSPMQVPADYTTSEVVGGDSPILAPGDACVAWSYRLVGYKKGDSLANALAAPLSITAPVFTDITTDHYVIVVNELCQGEGSPTESSGTTVVKNGDLAADIAGVIASPTKWFFYNDETNTIDNTLGSFVAGPSSAPLGLGSTQMSVSGTQRRNIATYQFKDIKLSDITTLSFSTYSQLAGDGALGLSERAAYLQFNVDFLNNDTWQRRLTFVPSINGVVVADSWQTWDAINSGNALWTYSGPTWPTTTDAGTTPKTWAQILALYPNAETRSTDSWLGFRVGEPYSDGFTGNVDKFVIGIQSGFNTHTETYDFEPETPQQRGAGGIGPVGVCSNNIDDDNDGLKDYPQDPGCDSATDSDESNAPQSATTTTGGGAPQIAGASTGPQGQVLGATASCGMYLNEYLKKGGKNNSEEVKKLQTFLNNYLNLSLPVTGFFGPQTFAAVIKFQQSEADLVLSPWVGITLKNNKKGTGYVYKTTKTRINNIMCPELNLQIPLLP